MVNWRRLIYRVRRFILIKKKYFIVIIIIAFGICLFLIFWFGLKGSFNSNGFLSDVFSSLIILILGSLVAWFLTHDYQRRKDKKQMKNQIIDEIQDLTFLLENTNISWKTWKENPKELENLQKTKLYASNAMDKAQIIQAKIENWFPQFSKTSFREEILQDEFKERKYGDLVGIIIDYGDFLIDTIDANDTRKEKSDQIRDMYAAANRFILMTIYGLISF